jgi:hypothetical protein
LVLLLKSTLRRLEEEDESCEEEATSQERENLRSRA